MSRSSPKRVLLRQRPRADGPMAAAPLHPSLFGRFTAVMSGHEQLGLTLRNLREMSRVLTRGSAGLPAELEPSALLAALRVELEEHFAVEEGDAYFGTIRAERSDLGGQVTLLIAEHSALLEQVASLEVLAQASEQHIELASLTLELLERLANHEKEETGVMAKYLSLK